MESSHSSGFTCITCRVMFANPDVQRDHYKTDWHRYNLKRKVAELPPVSTDVFVKRVINQRELDTTAKATPQAKLFCGLCKKNFSTEKSLENHVSSNKHKLAESKVDGVSEGGDSEVVLPPKQQKVPVAPPTEENLNEESEEEWDEGEGLALEECLFCPDVADSLDLNVVHMYKCHGFFIPDAEFCTDLQGLMTYLGEKVSLGKICLWCNERSKQFQTVEAVQKHMQDKGHCKLWHDGDAMLEYSDYYDYSTSYPDAENGAKRDEPVDVPVLPDDSWEMVLPSGTSIGHRMLRRYYRQNLKPESSLVSVANSTAVRPSRRAQYDLLKQYKSLGWTGCTTPAAALKKSKDVAFFKRFEAKNRLKLALSTNHLQKYYKHQYINVM